MTVQVPILVDNPVARSFPSRIVRESFSDVISITGAPHLEAACRCRAMTKIATTLHSDDEHLFPTSPHDAWLCR